MPQGLLTKLPTLKEPQSEIQNKFRIVNKSFKISTASCASATVLKAVDYILKIVDVSIVLSLCVVASHCPIKVKGT